MKYPTRFILFTAALCGMLAGCSLLELSGGIGPINECSSDSDCDVGSCDLDRGFCVAPGRSEPLVLVVRADDPTIAPFMVEDFQDTGDNLRDMTLPNGMLVGGRVSEGDKSIPAELTFDVVRDGVVVPQMRVIVSTYAQPREVEPFDAPVDYAVQLHAGEVYRVTVTPQPFNAVGSEPARLHLAPQTSMLDLSDINSAATTLNRTFTSVVEASCATKVRPCLLSGRVSNYQPTNMEALEVRVVETQTGRLVSSAGRTLDGDFELILGDYEGEIALDVFESNNASQTPHFRFPMTSFDALDFVLPDFSEVVFSGSVEHGPSSTALAQATLLFHAESKEGSWAFDVAAETDEDGAFSINLIPAQYTVKIFGEDVKSSAMMDSINPAVAIESLTIEGAGKPIQGRLFQTPERESLCGRVTFEGKEVGRAQLVATALRNVEAGDSLENNARSRMTTTDFAGDFQLRLDRGNYDISVRPAAATHLPWAIVTDESVTAVSSGQRCVPSDIEIGTPKVIDGVLRYRAQVLPGAIDVFKRFGDRLVQIGSTHTDDAGQFELLIP